MQEARVVRPQARSVLRRFKDLSIGGKLIWTFVPLIGSVVVFQVLYFPARQAEDARQALKAKARSITYLVAHDLGAAFEFGDVKAVEDVFQGAKNDPDLEFLVLFQGDGKRFAALNPEAAPKSAAASSAAVTEEMGASHLVLSVPVRTAGGTPGRLLAGFRTARISDAIRVNRLAAVTIGLLTLALGVALTLAISVYVSRRLRRFGELTERVAEGDLSVADSFEMDSSDEIGKLSASLRRMVERLREIVGNIQESSVEVASSSSQISAAAQQITRGAKSQAQAADETASAMAEMATSIQGVAANAGDLASQVEGTSSAITEMGSSIEEVAQSSATLARTVAEASTTIGGMSASLNAMAGRQGDLASTVTETSATIEEMISAIGSVARNAESLGKAVSTTSRTVSEMAGAVKDVAKIAGEADRISAQASEDARTGDEAVARTIEGMKGISSSMEATASVIALLEKRSQEIGKILGVINHIADQTNLLALNAAIEAARAGEAGRGFAVVADEVRKLAEGSLEATKEIGEIIREVKQGTEEAVAAARAGAGETKSGIELANQAGLALRRIRESVNGSSGLMARIASAMATQSASANEILATVAEMNAATTQVTTAVREQVQGSLQIRQAIENIDQTMQQAAALTREQAEGGRQVGRAVENINQIAAHVGVATTEQSGGSRQIIRAVESMNRMTRQVSDATEAQKRGGERVLTLMDNISEFARANLVAVEHMSGSTASLAKQAESLTRVVAAFKLQ